MQTIRTLKLLFSSSNTIYSKTCLIIKRNTVAYNNINKIIDDKTIYNILRAIHHAPSVGFSQPWNFLIKDKYACIKIKDSLLKERSKSIHY
ncbi:MAG: hypothetical protein ACTHKC_08190 [Candidatus Nitrosocosmicus sp.]